MDSYRHSVDPLGPVDGSAPTAEMMQNEFSQLIAIFDLQLSRLSDSDPEWDHILRAKKAATRGLELSRQLEGLLLPRS